MYMYIYMSQHIFICTYMKRDIKMLHILICICM